jgi:ATP-dependent Clp protease ATP-binding subunit ClpA
MTSNIGCKEAYNKNDRMGLISSKEEAKKDRSSIIQKAVDNHFKPEFINRVGKIIIVNELTDVEFIKIIKTRLLEIQQSTSIKVKYSDIDKLCEWVLEQAKKDPYNIAKFNAREILRVIIDKIENYIINIVSNSTEDITNITIDHTKMGEEKCI